MIMNDGTGV